MSTQENEDLIKYRFGKAKETFAEVAKMNCGM